MVSTYAIYPQGLLKDYVRCIAYREFNTGNESFYKPIHPHYEIYIALMINSKVDNFIPLPGIEQVPLDRSDHPDMTFSGLHSTMKGTAVYKGHIRFISMQFHPTGFFQLFGIPPALITDILGRVTDLFSNLFVQLQEQLHELESPFEMIDLTARFLVDKANQQLLKKRKPTLLGITGNLQHSIQTPSIERMAYQANMSLKTFERNFQQQVGMGPKQFQRVLRFSKSLGMKLYNPQFSWTDIAHKMGYFDQMHLIKDFKSLTNYTPSEFLRTTPPPLESSADANY